MNDGRPDRAAGERELEDYLAELLHTDVLELRLVEAAGVRLALRAAGLRCGVTAEQAGAGLPRLDLARIVTGRTEQVAAGPWILLERKRPALLRVDVIGETATVSREEVCWREFRAQKHWLEGMIERLGAALIDADALVGEEEH